MKILASYLLSVLLLAAVAPVGADELSDAMSGLCEKMKECARASMAGQEIPDNMKAMVDEMLEQSCAKLQQNYGAAARYHELYEPAVACMNSLNALSCEDIQQQGQNATAECQTFQEASEKYADG